MPLLLLSRIRFLAFTVFLFLMPPLWAGAAGSGVFWPQTIAREGVSLSLGEPKLESWDFLRLRLQASVECRDGGGAPLLGTVTLQARTFPNRATQTVALSGFEILALEAEGTGGGTVAAWQDKMAALLQNLRSSVPLDTLVDAFAPTRQLPSMEISSEAPRIFVSTKPAVLLQFDGPPMWLPVNGSKLSYAVNTNWDIFYDNKSTFYYLLAGDTWLASHDPLTEEWVIPKTLPKELKNLPRTPDFANVWKHLPYSANPDVVTPRVFYTETAAELILIDGEPVLEPVGETGISVVKNTWSDVFYEAGSKRFYTVLAGRWFETGELSGYWRNATRLPASMAAIPAGHPKAHVRAHVPGTPESRREAYRATIPHLATIKRKGPTVQVDFAGRPKYVPIDGTSLLWVPNATVPIVAHAGVHYACQHGVWFQAAKPEGPWVVASSLPEDIYRIPSRSPVFHLSFVRLVGSDAETVTFGFTGGYENLFVHDGVVVYGTGFSHPPALQYGAYTYPIYFAQPSTFGVGAWYDLESHVFLRGRPGYGPFGGFGATCRFNSVTSHYFRAQTLYGEDTGERPSLAFLPYTAAYGKLLATYEPYARWGDAVVAGGGASTSSRTPPVTAKTGAGKVTIQIGEPQVGAPGPSPQPAESGFRPPNPQ
jgi:hypothetical protein